MHCIRQYLALEVSLHRKPNLYNVFLHARAKDDPKKAGGTYFIVWWYWLLTQIIEDKNQWQAHQREKYDKLLGEAKTRGLDDAATQQLLFGEDFNQYEQDKADAVEVLKDNNGH